MTAYKSLMFPVELKNMKSFTVSKQSSLSSPIQRQALGRALDATYGTPPMAHIPRGETSTPPPQNLPLWEFRGLAGGAVEHFRWEESQGRQVFEERRPHLKA